MLTIAHRYTKVVPFLLSCIARLDTIIDSDRVMVLDKGELREMDSPNILLSNPQSLFYQLVESSIQVASDQQEEQK